MQLFSDYQIENTVPKKCKTIHKYENKITSPKTIYFITYTQTHLYSIAMPHLCIYIN